MTLLSIPYHSFLCKFNNRRDRDDTPTWQKKQHSYPGQLVYRGEPVPNQKPDSTPPKPVWIRVLVVIGIFLVIILSFILLQLQL